MIAKVIRGSTFRGVLDYVFDSGSRATGKKNPEWVGGNMGSLAAKDLAEEFSLARSQRPDIERPVWHCSLSLPEGERLETDRWGEVAEDFMKSMGFSERHQYTAVRHSDTAYDHVHIIASRVGIDGKIWLGRWEAREAIRVSRELEEKHNLIQGKGYEGKAERKALTRGEINQAKRTLALPPRRRLQDMLDEFLADAVKPTLVELARALEAKGVDVRIKTFLDGSINGISFGLDGINFRGSSLGKAYSWGGLQKRGVTPGQVGDNGEHCSL
jgi:hypothetical protein